MKYPIILLCLLSITGCNTTQSAQIETKQPVAETPVKEETPRKEPLRKNPDPNENPFHGLDINPNQVVNSGKPVSCGRIDIVLGNMEKKYGEVPIVMGDAEFHTGPGQKAIIKSVLTYNPKTGTYTFLEQMPMERRLICILSSGTAKLIPLKKSPKGTAL